MMECLLKINGLPVTTLDLRRQPSGKTDILVVDPRFGEFPLAPSCLIEYLDLSNPDLLREPDHSLAWKRLTYEELAVVIEAYLRLAGQTN